MMSRQIKAILGIGAMVVLLVVVFSYFNQYRHAAEIVATTKPPSYESTTSTAAVTTKAKASTASSKKSSSSKDKTEPRKGQKVVVVQIQGLNFRESPDKNANVIRGLDEKEELIWLSTDGSWYRVVDASGVEGFVTSNDQYAKLGTKK